MDFLKKQQYIGLINISENGYEKAKLAASLLNFDLSSFQSKIDHFKLFPNFEYLIQLWQSIEDPLTFSLVYMQVNFRLQNEVLYFRKCYRRIDKSVIRLLLEGEVKLRKSASDRLKCDFTKDPQNYSRVRIVSTTPVGQTKRKTPIVFHCHGGGFISMTSFSHLCYLKPIAEETGWPVFSVDYSLSPEKYYPYALDEAYQFYRWLVDYAETELLLEIEYIVLLGDSAGGNLVSALTNLLIRTRVEPLPKEIFLFYPAANLDKNTVSLSNLAVLEDFLLPYYVMDYIILSYTNGYANKEDFFLNTINTPPEVLKKWPKTVIYSSEMDCLRDYSLIFLEKLLEAGVESHLYMLNDFPHGFLNFSMSFVSPEVTDVYTHLASLMK